MLLSLLLMMMMLSLLLFTEHEKCAHKVRELMWHMTFQERRLQILLEAQQRLSKLLLLLSLVVVVSFVVCLFHCCLFV